MSDHILEIPWQQCLDLRSRVLRPGLAIEQSHFVGDDLASSFHLGFHRDGQIIGIATFVSETYPDLPRLRGYRLRGMAVDPEFRRQKIGDQILRAGEEKLRREFVEVLWFNAREKAILFYESLGYSTRGPLFDIPGVGPHKVMLKRF